FYSSIGPGIGSVIPLDDHLGRDVNELKIVSGRLPRDDVPNEAVISFALAEQYHLRVGDTYPIYKPSDIANLTADERAQANAFVRDADRLGNRMRIVGIEATPGEFPPQFGTGRLLVHLSPAFAHMGGIVHDGATRQPVLMVRLRRGARDVDQFRRDV